MQTATQTEPKKSAQSLTPNEVANHLAPGKLITFIGGAGTRKTQAMIRHVAVPALNNGEKVIHFCCGENRDSVAERYLSEATLNNKGPFSLAEKLLVINLDHNSNSVFQVLAEIKKALETFSASTIVIDELGLMSPVTHSSKYLEIKSLAKENGAVVTASLHPTRDAKDLVNMLVSSSDYVVGLMPTSTPI